MIEWLCGNLMIALTVSLITMWYCKEEPIVMVKTITVREPTPTPTEAIDPWLSNEGRYRWITEQMLVAEQGYELSSEEKVFMNKYIVTEIQRDLSKDLNEAINAQIEYDVDAESFEMDPTTGSGSIGISTRKLSDDEFEAFKKEIQKRVAAKIKAIHWSSVKVERVGQDEKSGASRKLLSTCQAMSCYKSSW